MKSASRIALFPLVLVGGSEKGSILAALSTMASGGAGVGADSVDFSMVTPFVVERRRQKRQEVGTAIVQTSWAGAILPVRYHKARIKPIPCLTRGALNHGIGRPSLGHPRAPELFVSCSR